MNKSFDVNVSLFKGNEKTKQPEKQPINLEPILHNFVDEKLGKLSFCLPAKVVNIQHMDELRVDVQPLNIIRHKDNEETEMPVIKDVPMFCYGTDDSAFLIPVKQGQTVLLLFAHKSIDDFKSGSIEPYSPFSNRFADIQDAIALPSIFPFNRSPNRDVRHYTEHSLNDVTVVHNLGTSRENKVVLGVDGSVKIQSPSQLTVDAPNSLFKGEAHFEGKVETDVDFIIQGRSVKKFMDTHTHNYTDDGSPMVTEKPNEV